MSYRKTWFDYVLWVVYAGLCVTLLAYVGNRIYAFYVGKPMVRLGTFLPFPVLLCLYPGLRLSCQAIRKKYSPSAHLAAMAEALIVSVSFVFGLLVRISSGRVTAAIYEMTAVEAGSYYENAVVRMGEGSAPLIHGMSDLYVRCLRLVFSFLGNSAASAILFQVVLQLLAMLFAYLAVRKAAGRFAGCTVLLLLTFSDTFISMIDEITPECLFTALFLFGLYLVISFVKTLLAGRAVYGGWPGMFLLGVLLGLLCFLDGGSVLLFLFLAGLFTGKTDAVREKKRRIGSLLIVISGALAGFFGAVAEDAAMSGVIFYRGLMNWTVPYLDPARAARSGILLGMQYPFFLIVFLLAAFVVFEFIRGGREQNFSLWLLPGILVTPVFLIDISVVGYGGIALFLWCVMAGLGLKSVVFSGQADLVREKIEAANAAAQEAVSLSMQAASAVPAFAGAAGQMDVPQEKPRFIENPLPLPKKHVKREMDYDHAVPEANMHYDVEIAEGDDFDH